MKKTISYIMIICVLVSLGGCVWDPASYLFDYDELKEQIDIFMTSLSKSHRQIFILRYWYFMPVKEIAKCTNMSISKVESILFRTRKKLKKQLTERKYL